jgi:hypothetical protein
MTAAAQLVGKAVANQIDVGSIIAFDRWAMCNTPEQHRCWCWQQSLSKDSLQ